MYRVEYNANSHIQQRDSVSFYFLTKLRRTNNEYAYQYKYQVDKKRS